MLDALLLCLGALAHINVVTVETREHITFHDSHCEFILSYSERFVYTFFLKRVSGLVNQYLAYNQLVN